ncbi:MAG: outer membrane protein assembly factor BamB [Gammaproteobacteria bacterium]|nr:outer membrane protein assembly factor BamB [Gammaproteobacteria bacterium]
MKRPLPIVLATLLLSGCSSMNPLNWLASNEPNDPPAALTEIESPIAVRAIWERSVGGGTDEKRIKLVVTVDLDRLYLAQRDGSVMAVEAASGKEIWKTDTGLSLSGGPGFGEGLVLVGTSDAEVVALGAESGEERWRARVSSEVLSVPKIAQNVVVVHTVDGKLFGLDALDGSQLWAYDRSVPVLTLHGSSSPVISGDKVICGFSNGKLVGLNLATGAVLWESSVGIPSGRTELERMVDIDGDPLSKDGVIFVTSFQGDLVAVDESSGNVYWRRKLSAFVGPGIDWRGLYVADAQGQVWGVDYNNGSALWKNKQLINRWLTSPAVLGDYVVVGDLEGWLHWLSSRDGRLLGRVRVGDAPITAAPVVYDERLYVLGDSGRLAAFALPSDG